MEGSQFPNVEYFEGSPNVWSRIGSDLSTHFATIESVSFRSVHNISVVVDKIGISFLPTKFEIPETKKNRKQVENGPNESIIFEVKELEPHDSFAKPYVCLFLLSLESAAIYRAGTKTVIRKWLDYVKQADMEWLLLNIHFGGGNKSDKGYRRLTERIRSDFQANSGSTSQAGSGSGGHGSHIYMLSLNDSTQDGAGGGGGGVALHSLSELSSSLMDLLSSAMYSRLKQYDERVRELQQNRMSAAFSFSELVLWKEGLAAFYESFGLLTEALREAEELEVLCYDLLLGNGGEGESQESIPFGAIDVGDCDGDIFNMNQKPFRSMLWVGSTTKFDYLVSTFARQMHLRLALGQVATSIAKTLVFLKMMFSLLRERRRQIQPLFPDQWLYNASMCAFEHYSGLTAAAPIFEGVEEKLYRKSPYLAGIGAFDRNFLLFLGDMLLLARDGLRALGKKYGVHIDLLENLLNEGQQLMSSDIRFDEHSGASRDDDNANDSASVVIEPSLSHSEKNDSLKELLLSRERYLSEYLGNTHKAIICFEYCGHKRTGCYLRLECAAILAAIDRPRDISHLLCVPWNIGSFYLREGWQLLGDVSSLIIAKSSYKIGVHTAYLDEMACLLNSEYLTRVARKEIFSRIFSVAAECKTPILIPLISKDLRVTLVSSSIAGKRVDSEEVRASKFSVQIENQYGPEIPGIILSSTAEKSAGNRASMFIEFFQTARSGVSEAAGAILCFSSASAVTDKEDFCIITCILTFWSGIVANGQYFAERVTLSLGNVNFSLPIERISFDVAFSDDGSVCKSRAEAIPNTTSLSSLSIPHIVSARGSVASLRVAWFLERCNLTEPTVRFTVDGSSSHAVSFRYKGISTVRASCFGENCENNVVELLESLQTERRTLALKIPETFDLSQPGTIVLFHLPLEIRQSDPILKLDFEMLISSVVAAGPGERARSVSSEVRIMSQGYNPDFENKLAGEKEGPRAPTEKKRNFHVFANKFSVFVLCPLKADVESVVFTQDDDLEQMEQFSQVILRLNIPTPLNIISYKFSSPDWYNMDVLSENLPELPSPDKRGEDCTLSPEEPEMRMLCHVTKPTSNEDPDGGTSEEEEDLYCTVEFEVLADDISVLEIEKIVLTKFMNVKRRDVKNKDRFIAAKLDGLEKDLTFVEKVHIPVFQHVGPFEIILDFPQYSVVESFFTLSICIRRIPTQKSTPDVDKSPLMCTVAHDPLFWLVTGKTQARFDPAMDEINFCIDLCALSAGHISLPQVSICKDDETISHSKATSILIFPEDKTTLECI